MTTDLSLVLGFRQSLKACTACSLSEIATAPVPWSGDINPTYAVLGMNPGKTEDRTGLPFVGDSGNILRHWLKQTGYVHDLNSMVYLNAVNCYSRVVDPTPDQVAKCRPWLHGQLEFIRPKVLITMGVLAYEALTQLRWPKLQHVHGKPLRHPVYGFMIVPTYHPAAYLRGRNKTYEDKIVADLTAARHWWEYEQAGEVWPSDECYVCGDEFYNWNEWSIPLCWRHCQKQGILFPEDTGASI